MTVNDLQILYDYGYWANERFFDVLSQLTDEQFIQPVAGSYGSLRNTLVHMLSAEWGWLERCGGAARGPVLIASDYPTLESVQLRWREIEGHLREFLARLREEDLERSIEFSFGNGPKQVRRLGELMHHAAIHGVHHRGQIALLLRCLGYTPGNVDILLYYGDDVPQRRGIRLTENSRETVSTKSPSRTRPIRIADAFRSSRPPKRAGLAPVAARNDSVTG